MPHYDNPNIHFRMPCYGMTGYLENFYDADSTGAAPVFALTDSQEPNELCLFIQTPDCYRECMKYATIAYYQRVNIFANQIRIRFRMTTSEIDSRRCLTGFPSPIVIFL